MAVALRLMDSRLVWRHYVYQHRRADDGTVFYVGKGTLRARQRRQICERAYAHSSRSTRWHRTVAKHGLVVEIVANFLDDASAQDFERELIGRYGRAQLVNMTDGGDGHAGIVCSPALRATRSVNARGPRSSAWIDAIRRARKNGGNGGVVRRGDRLPDAWRQAIARAKTGNRNPMHGRCGERHPTALTVVDTLSGARYPSVTAAAKASGMRMQTLHNMLSGRRTNSTALRLVAATT